MLNRTLMTLLLPVSGPELKVDGQIVADTVEYDCDSTSILAHNTFAAIFDRRFKATFIVPLEHYDYKGVAKGEPGSVITNGRDLIEAIDSGLQGKVRIDFLYPRNDTAVKAFAQLTFTRKSSAAFFKLMLA